MEQLEKELVKIFKKERKEGNKYLDIAILFTNSLLKSKNSCREP